MLKSKVTHKAEPTAAPKAADTKKKSGGSKYDKELESLRGEMRGIQEKIKAVLVKKMNETNPGWEIGSTVFYPAPPQKKVIPCILELEEDSDHNITFFVRPIVYKKDGSTEMSKRHYSVGSDLNAAEGLSKTAPKGGKSKKTEAKPEKAVTKKTAAPAAPAKEEKSSKVVQFPTKKKPTLGKKK